MTYCDNRYYEHIPHLHVRGVIHIAAVTHQYHIAAANTRTLFLTSHARSIFMNYLQTSKVMIIIAYPSSSLTCTRRCPLCRGHISAPRAGRGCAQAREMHLQEQSLSEHDNTRLALESSEIYITYTRIHINIHS